MPPLLPEYLSQPVQIVYQSPSTDWEAIIAGGLFTLLGAAAGAGLGGWVAYRASIRAGQKIVNQSKVEEALTLLSRIDFFRRKNLSLFAGRLPNSDSAAIWTAMNHDNAFNALLDSEKLLGLMKLHAPESVDEANKLIEQLKDAVAHCDTFKSIDTPPLTLPKRRLRKQLSESAREQCSHIYQLCSSIESKLLNRAKTY